MGDLTGLNTGDLTGVREEDYLLIRLKYITHQKMSFYSELSPPDVCFYDYNSDLYL